MSDQVLSYALTGDASGAKVAFNDVGAAITANTKSVAELAKSLKTVAGNMDKTVERADATASASHKLAKSFEASSNESAKLVQGLRNAAMEIPALQSGATALAPALAAMTNPLVLLPAAFATAAVGAGALSLANADLVEHMDNLKATTGLSVNELFNLREIAIPMGLDFDSQAKSAQKLAINLGANGKEIQALKLGGGDIVEVMAQVADRFAAAGSTVEKDAIAYAAFGKSFAEIAPILAQGGDRIRSLSQNIAISESDLEKYRELDEVSDQMESHWRQIKFDIGGIAAGPMTTLLSLAKDLTGVLDSDPKEKGSLAYIKRLASDPALAARGYSVTNTGAENSRIIADYERSQAADSLMARAGQIAQARKDAAELAEKDRLEALRQAREKALPKELALQQELRDRLEELQATADQREILAIQAKYDKIVREHQNGKTRELAELARQAELQALAMRQNFAALAAERDADEREANSESDSLKSLQDMSGNADKDFERFRGYSFGAYRLANPSGIEIDSASAETARSSQMPGSMKKAQEAAEETRKTYANLANYVSGDFANSFARSAMAIQNSQGNVAAQVKRIWMDSLYGVEQKIVELVAKSAMLSLSNGLTGGAAGPVGGLFDYVVKGISGHADGTLSAPGGLATLSERGMERILTPQGGDFYASRGLYGISPGSRVIPANQVSGGGGAGRIELHQHFYGSDPIQVAEQSQRAARETVSQWDKDGFRSREIY